MSDSETSKAWRKLFSEKNILHELNQHGIFYITAEQIKNLSGREPRLMCKFDYRNSRPEILRANDITVLPVENGTYALVKGDGYTTLPPPNKETKYRHLHSSAQSLETLSSSPSSESQVIDLAYATGILSDFLDDNNLILTIRGRRRTKQFQFFFYGYKLFVLGVQVEVDAGYESHENIYLIEAKMGEWDDFHIRQLYFPYRMWLENDVSKNIIPLFITYSNKIISITQYCFDDMWVYNSIKPIRTASYSFDPAPLAFDFNAILKSISPNKNVPQNVPFPQADDLRKVRDTIDLVSWGKTTKNEIAEFWEIDPRQGDYYLNAAKYIGLLDKKMIRGG